MKESWSSEDTSVEIKSCFTTSPNKSQEVNYIEVLNVKRESSFSLIESGVMRVYLVLHLCIVVLVATNTIT